MSDSKPGASLTVLVLSCDGYADAWPPFFTLFDRFWPDCPYPVRLVSETRDFAHPRVNVLKPGQRMKWADLLIWAVEQLDTTHVLLLLEDYLLLKPVDSARVAHYWQWIQAHDAAYLRLLPVPEPPAALPGLPEIGELPPGTPYRTSTQAAIWRRDALLAVLAPGESGWAYERDSVARSAQVKGGFYSLTLDAHGHPVERGDYPLTYFCTAINKGKWVGEAVKAVAELGVVIDTSHRGVETRKVALIRRVERALKQVLYRLTGRYRLKQADG